MTTINLETEYEQVADLREALIIGLEAIAEIERAQAEFRSEAAHNPALTKKVMPRHPTGDAETTGQFASALRLVELIGWLVRQADETQEDAE